VARVRTNSPIIGDIQLVGLRSTRATSAAPASVLRLRVLGDHLFEQRVRQKPIQDNMGKRLGTQKDPAVPGGDRKKLIPIEEEHAFHFRQYTYGDRAAEITSTHPGTTQPSPVIPSFR